MIRKLFSSLRARKDLYIPIALVGIAIAGAGLRFYEIGKQPLWLDEAFSVWMGWNPVTEIIRLTIEIDQHPPFYHLLLHYWMLLGGVSAVWVRTFSAILGVLSIFAIYKLGKTLSGPVVGLLSALVLAFSPFHVQYGQEARTYALLTFTATMSMWMTARLLVDPLARTQSIGQQFEDFILHWRRQRAGEASEDAKGEVGYARDFREDRTWVTARTERSWLPIRQVETDLTWLAYMLFTALTVYGHNTAIFLPIGINLFVFGLMLVRRFLPARAGQLQAPSFKNWFIAQVGVFLIWSPWLLALYFQAVGVAGDFWIPAPTLSSVLGTLQTFLMANLPGRSGWQWLVWAGFVAAFALALVKYRGKAAHFMFLAALFLAPFLGELLVSLRRPIFYDRTLIWCTIPLFVLVAAGISQLRFRPYILAISLALVVVSWFSIKDYYTYFEKERWDQAAAFVAKNVQEGDILLFNAGWTEIPFDYYFAQYNHKVEEFGAPETMFENGVLEPRMAASDLPRLRGIIRGRARIWLVYSHNWWTDPQSLIPAELGKELHLKDSQRFNGMEIQLYSVE